MAISKPKKYIHKDTKRNPRPRTFVSAVRVTERNFISAAHWVAGEEFERGTAETKERFDKKLDKFVDQRVRVKVPGKGWRVAGIGDYIVRAEDKTFFVVKGEEFESQHVLVVRANPLITRPFAEK